MALCYGIVSDCLGESGRVSANSVIGLVREALACSTAKRGAPPLIGTAKAPPMRTDYVVLIEAGYRLRQGMLRRPGVQAVDVAVMGPHLVLTVYKDVPGIVRAPAG